MTTRLRHAAPLASAAHAAFNACRDEHWLALANARLGIELHYRRLVVEVAQYADDIGMPFRHRAAMRDLMRAKMDLGQGIQTRTPGVVDRALREIARTADRLAEPGENHEGAPLPALPSNVIRLPLRRVVAFLAPNGPEAA